MAEWVRRCNRYVSLTRKLRISFYPVLLVAVLLVFFGTDPFRSVGVVLFFLNFLGHFGILWLATSRILRCPHCGAVPISGRGSGAALYASVCNHCLSYLKPLKTHGTSGT
jgi:hypothetical protein